MLISVIIPVYNVEKYIQNCVESLIIPDMNDVEILLIDDGSTDNSGNICDALAGKYNNIRVFHKKNGGLSDARNYGISKSTGSWISLIDSDDMVVPNYLNIMKKMINSLDRDIFIFKYKKFDDGERIFTVPNSFDASKLHKLSKPQAMFSLTKEKYGNYAWNKLYKRELFHDIEYPIGKGYEDIFTTYLLYEKAKNIALYEDILYFYRQRASSIVYEKQLDKKVLLFEDRYEAMKLQNTFFGYKEYFEAYKRSKRYLINYALILVTYIETFDCSKNNIYESAVKLLKDYSPSVARDGLKIYVLLIFRKHFTRTYKKLMHIFLAKKV